jgi:hypothetical protein
MEEGILTIIEEARAARLGHLAIVGADLPQWKVLKELEYNFALRSRHG